MERELLVFDYNSDNVYYTAPSTGGTKVLELIPINSDLEGGEVKKEGGYKFCGCSCTSHPILLSSDENVLVAENIVPVRIQVECPLPKDQVMSQHCIHSLGPIHTPKCVHSSCSSHIASLAC